MSKPNKTPCSIEGCKRSAKVRGYCPYHYHWLWKRGLLKVETPWGSGEIPVPSKNPKRYKVGGRKPPKAPRVRKKKEPKLLKIMKHLMSLKLP